LKIEKGLKPKDRSIVNISSTSGLHGNAGQANYATAKSGINGLTKTIAKEWGPLGIRSNSIAFGRIETRLTQLKGNSEIMVQGEKVTLGIPKTMQEMTGFIPLSARAGTVEEAAGSVLLMVSPFSSYITGHCLQVTGGVGI